MNGQNNLYGGQAAKAMTPFDAIMSALQARAMKTEIQRNRIINQHLPNEIESRVSLQNAQSNLYGAQTRQVDVNTGLAEDYGAQYLQRAIDETFKDKNKQASKPDNVIGPGLRVPAPVFPRYRARTRARNRWRI